MGGRPVPAAAGCGYGERSVHAVKLQKGIRRMSWYEEAMKGVEVCEKPGVADKQASIPGLPNWRLLNP